MFYLFHGKDTHSQRETLEKLLAEQGDPEMISLNTTRFDARLSFSELQQASMAMPFLSPVRLVIVEDLFVSVPDKAFMEQLEEFLPQLPATTRLVFLESKPLPSNHRIIRLAKQEKSGHERAFKLPEGAGLNWWIQERAREKGGQISGHATQVLAANVGNDLGILDNELEKLVLYKGPDEPIDVDDVALLSPYAAEASIFALVDALGNRQAAAAATLLQKKLNDGADPFYLFSMFVRQFRLLIQVKELLEAGQRPPEIAKKIRLAPFVAEKMARQSQGFSMRDLEHIYKHLLQIDVDAKTGRGDMLTGLHLLLAGLTVEV